MFCVCWETPGDIYLSNYEHFYLYIVPLELQGAELLLYEVAV